MKPPKRLPKHVLESLSEQPQTSNASGSDEIETVPSLTKEKQERLERKRAKKLGTYFFY